MPPDTDGIPSNMLFHYIVTGQSLSTGTQGAPGLSTTQPFRNKMFTESPTTPTYATDPLSFNAITLGHTDIALRSLLVGPPPTGNFTYETIANGFADSLSALHPNYTQLLSCSGIGGASYSVLAGPTDYPPNGSPSFQEMMSQISHGFALATAAGLQYTVPAMLLIHGEFDGGAGSAYADHLKTWQMDMQVGVNAITGLDQTIPILAAQTQVPTNAQGDFNTMPFWPDGGALGTLSAATANPDRIYVTCPEYMIAHHYYQDTNGAPDPGGQPVHLNSDGYRHLGQMMAKAAHALFIRKTNWTPLAPLSFVLHGNAIKIQYSVPVAPIVFDTSYVSDPGNYGFNYTDQPYSATAPPSTAIVNVQVSGPSEVTITLASASPGGYLSYARVDPGPAGGAPYNQGFGPNAGPRGCLRDSDTTASYYCNSKTGQPYPMQNYCVCWQQELQQS